MSQESDNTKEIPNDNEKVQNELITKSENTVEMGNVEQTTEESSPSKVNQSQAEPAITIDVQHSESEIEIPNDTKEVQNELLTKSENTVETGNVKQTKEESSPSKVNQTQAEPATTIDVRHSETKIQIPNESDTKMNQLESEGGLNKEIQNIDRPPPEANQLQIEQVITNETENIKDNSKINELPTEPELTEEEKFKLSLLKARRLKVKHIIIEVGVWVAIIVYIIDLVFSIMIYQFWTTTIYKVRLFHATIIAWLVVTGIGVIFCLLIIYKLTLLTISEYCKSVKIPVKLDTISHQYYLCFLMVLYEIPKAMIYLIFVLEFSFSPIEVKGSMNQGFMGVHKHDDLIFMMTLNILKLFVIIFISVFDIRDIILKDGHYKVRFVNLFLSFINFVLQIVILVFKVQAKTE